MPRNPKITELSEAPVDEIALAWLAGLLEADGTFFASPPSQHNSPKIAVQMTDLDTIERAAGIWGCKVFGPIAPKGIGIKPSYRAVVAGITAVRWMKRLYPYMSIRRKAQIDKAIDAWVPPLHYRSEEVAMRLHAGENYLALADEYGCSHQTVHAYGRKHPPED